MNETQKVYRQQTILLMLSYYRYHFISLFTSGITQISKIIAFKLFILRLLCGEKFTQFKLFLSFGTSTAIETNAR